MHSLCGQLNPTNICMENNYTCKNKYPKEYVLHTSLGNISYPLYKRRNDGVNEYKQTIKNENSKAWTASLGQRNLYTVRRGCEESPPRSTKRRLSTLCEECSAKSTVSELR